MNELKMEFEGEWYQDRDNMKWVIGFLERRIEQTSGRARHYYKEDLKRAQVKLAELVLTAP